MNDGLEFSLVTEMGEGRTRRPPRLFGGVLLPLASILGFDDGSPGSVIPVKCNYYDYYYYYYDGSHGA
jgi:hypothetical protein